MQAVIVIVTPELIEAIAPHNEDFASRLEVGQELGLVGGRPDDRRPALEVDHVES